MLAAREWNCLVIYTFCYLEECYLTDYWKCVQTSSVWFLCKVDSE